MHLLTRRKVSLDLHWKHQKMAEGSWFCQPSAAWRTSGSLFWRWVFPSSRETPDWPGAEIYLPIRGQPIVHFDELHHWMAPRTILDRNMAINMYMMNITSILTGKRAVGEKKGCGWKNWTYLLEYCTDCTQFLSELNQYLSLEVIKISTCCRSSCAGLIILGPSCQPLQGGHCPAQLGSSPRCEWLHCSPPQWRALIVRSSLVNWLITSLMREKRPRHNVRIVGNGQVTSEPKNKAVLNLMKCPPRTELARFLNMGSVSLGRRPVGAPWFGRLPLSVSGRFTVNLILYKETVQLAVTLSLENVALLKLIWNCH